MGERKKADALIYQRKYALAAECTPEEKEARFLRAINEIASLQSNAYFCDFDKARWEGSRAFIMLAALRISLTPSNASDEFMTLRAQYDCFCKIR